MFTQKYKKYILVSFLVLFSFLINKHYANYGVEPGDTFVLYNGGYKVLNGYVPFIDYWLTTGPLLDYLNALFFIFLDVNWQAYTTHSSVFNVLIGISTFFFLKNFNINILLCFFYSATLSLMMYPVVGTPFVDHHSTIFMVISFYFFSIAIKDKKYKFFIFIPSILLFSFLSKQTPASYGIIVLTILSLIEIFSRRDLSILKFGILGVFLAIIIFSLFMFLTKIPLDSFLDQYIFYGSSIGTFRLQNFDFDLFGILHQYKFLLASSFLLFLLSLNIYLKDKILSNFLSIISIILLSFILLFHQLLTLNENFIFFLAPLLLGLSHSCLARLELNKNIFQYILILFCIFVVFKYHLRFNENRKFHTLEFVDLTNAVEAVKISKDLKGLKWITKKYSKNPKNEVDGIIEAIEILKKDKTKYALITNYLFISPILNRYDFSPNQWHHPGVSFPLKGSKYFSNYKDFFANHFAQNKISTAYIVGEESLEILDLVYDENCFKKEKIGFFIYKFKMKDNCKIK